MPGLFGWGPKDDMTPAEVKAARQNAKEQMRQQKPPKKTSPKTPKTPKSNPRHETPKKGLWGSTPAEDKPRHSRSDKGGLW